MHFYYFSREEVFDLTYSVTECTNGAKYCNPASEALPKSQKKIKTEGELFDHLRGKYGV